MGSFALRLGVRSLALGYLLLILVVPLAMIFYRTFEGGLQPVVATLTSPAAVHAAWMTLTLMLVAVPLNTVFGVVCALLMVRSKSRLRGVLNTVLDLPFTISPVVVGLALILLYGQGEPAGAWLAERGIQVIFSWPGMLLATIFVCLPFVAREVIPVLQEVGTQQEQAAATLGASRWQTFWQITLPSIRWGLVYGVVLTTARALGEYGAVAVVSGKVSGSTETLTLFVDNRYHQFDTTGAYSASLLLAAIALVVLVVMHRLKPKGEAESL